jgi:predicted O-methyltransferase YrrM
MKARRYENLTREVRRIQAKRILEVGTCRGRNAALMMKAGGVEYFGFDLFEAPPENELSANRQPDAFEAVKERLGAYGKVRLFKGNTRQTLPVCGVKDIDLAFIDGGHSDETVRSDFEAIVPMMRHGGVILLDDYWNYGEGGCNALVDSLEGFEVTFLEPVDQFEKPYGTLRTQIVRVVAR